MKETYKSHILSYDGLESMSILREKVDSLDLDIQCCCPDGREKEIAIQKLEECLMWANKAIALSKNEEDK